MKRRDFLRNMAVMPLVSRSCIGGGSLLASIKSSYAASGKTLIVIFQEGGCDGLNVVVPYGEDEYYNLRPDISIASPGSGSNSALDLDGFFGLHPAMGGLYEIFQQGDLAVLPTVHYENANRSHFSSQDFIEGGVPNKSLSDGWLNRYLSSAQQSSKLSGISFGSLSHAMRGTHSVITLPSLSGDFRNSEKDVLQNIYSEGVTNNSNRSLLHKHGASALNSLSSIETFSKSAYTVQNGAVYPDTSYGQQLKNIAQLVKQGAGLEVATVLYDGWDHHANQGGAEGDQATKLAVFSAGIEAIYRDLGPEYMNDVVILTATEFGRTAKQNASQGTDHGNAASWFVIGQQVNGGIYGDWPGLQPEQLYQSRYLDHTIEFTDVYAEILSKHLGEAGSLPFILPESQYSQVGFLT